MADYSGYSLEELRKMRAELGGTPMEEEGNWLTRNLDVPASMAGSVGGAMTGAAIGSAVPVVGTAIGGIIGGIAGGALGAGAGSVVSDLALEESVDWREAADKAVESAAWDAALMGAGKALRPMFRAVGGTAMADLIKSGGYKLFNAKQPTLADDLIDMEGIQAGSIEAARLTQDALVKRSQGKGGLSAVQTGQASAVRRFFEFFGDTGLLSRNISESRVVANNKVITEMAEELTDLGYKSSDTTMAKVGEKVYGIIEAGRAVASKAYGEGLDRIIAENGTRQVSAAPLKNALLSFQKRNSGALGSDLQKGTKGVVSDLLSDVTKTVPKKVDPRAGMKKLGGRAATSSAIRETEDELAVFATSTAKSTDIASLLNFQKKVNKRVEEALPSGKNADPASYRELSMLSSDIKDAIQLTLGKFSPNTASSFKRLNKEFGETAQNLLPKINKNVIANGDKDSFKALGQLLIKPNDTNKITAMMNSIDEAYAVAKGVKGGMKDAPIRELEKAKKLVRQGYLENVFKDLVDGNDFVKFQNKVDGLFDKEGLEKAKAIMGEDFNEYKKALLIMSTARGGGDKTLFDLALRQRELTAVSGAQLVGSGAASALNPLFAAAVFTLPTVMAKIATNKAAVNRLLSVSKQVEKNGITELTTPLILANLGKVIGALSEEDQDDIRKDINSYYGY
jgi:hypothetical protein